MQEKIIETEIRCRHCLHRYKVKMTINTEIIEKTETEKLEKDTNILNKIRSVL